VAHDLRTGCNLEDRRAAIPSSCSCSGYFVSTQDRVWQVTWCADVGLRARACKRPPGPASRSAHLVYRGALKKRVIDAGQVCPPPSPLV